MRAPWLTVLAAAAAAALECPLPAGPDSADPATCGLYSACLWTGDQRCELRQDIGYQLDTYPVVIHSGYEADLHRRSNASMFGADVERLHVLAVNYDDRRLGVSFRDAAASRYEVPLLMDLPPLPTNASERVYDVSLTGGPPAPRQPPTADPDFQLRVEHRGSAVLTMLPEFIYSDQFIEASFLLGSSDIYGFGENNHDRFRHNLSAGVTWPMFALDRPPGDGVENLYGVHPFFLGIEDDSGRSFGVLFLNSNAMEYKLFLLDGAPALTFRTTGGILDMYLFFGDSPLEVLQQYYKSIGHPAMPPYWGLGFQLCRYGYTGTDDIRAVRKRMEQAHIPQDIQYSDIDYMDVRRDFTIDPVNFGDLPEYIAELRDQDIHFVLIYDPAIAVDFGKYPPVDRGVEQDVFVKWMSSDLVPADQCDGCKDYMVGYVWPVSKTVFPDFFKNDAVGWWIEEIRKFREKAGSPDGFWIDMNEPSSFGTNTEKPFNWPDDLPPWSLKCPNNTWEDPPYPTRWARDPNNESKRLSDHTICMSGLHTNDVNDESPTFRHYDVHSLYGWAESSATRLAMDMLLDGRRGVLFGRSTFPGAGRWVGHWTGDNSARWTDMRRSLVGLFEFNMFGIPYVGADICGFNGNTTEELCLRWTQLGAFYPFSRNHNTIGTAPQDPAVWPSVAAAAREALGLRYRLLPYLYTLFWRAAAFGETVVRPLAFQFASDPSLRDIDRQFLWGDGVMVAPVLDEDAMTSVTVTFPAGEWYDLRNGTRAFSGPSAAAVNYHVAMDEMIPVFARGGTILPAQRNETTTVAARRNPFSVLVFGEQATGELYWDDGESRVTFQAFNFYHCAFRFADGVFSMEVTSPKTDWMEQPYLNKLHFHGVAARPSAVVADGEPVSEDDVSFEAGLLAVRVQLDMASNHTVELKM